MTNKILLFLTAGCLVAAGCSSTPTPVEPPKEKVEAPSASIHQAAYKGDIETILQHHAAGTDIDLRNQWNATPPLLRPLRKTDRRSGPRWSRRQCERKER